MSRVCVLIRRGEEAMWCGHVDNSPQEHGSGDLTLDTGQWPPTGWFPVRTGSGVETKVKRRFTKVNSVL